jgi:hypothetical protein
LRKRAIHETRGCKRRTPCDVRLGENDMPDEIWVSTVGSNYWLFDKEGIREKHYGQDWAPPKFEMDALPPEQYQNVLRHSRGEKLRREDFVEAAYVFDPKR